MADDVLKIFAEARVDARSLSEFVFKPASFIVTRRLAPPINTLEYYLNLFNKTATDGAAMMNQVIINSGFVTIDSFELGATITQRNQALRHAVDGRLYRWSGNLPKVVSTNSTPTSSGGMGDNAWLEVSDVTLRQELANPYKGAAMVGFKQEGEGAVDRNLVDKAREWVSVKDFGAVGDGAHELDRRAFLRASDNRTSYIVPNGEYASNSNDPIIIRDETTVQGQGSSTVVNSKMALMSNFGRLKNLQLQSVEQLPNTPAITAYENPTALEGSRSLCCSIEDVTIRNSSGVYNSAVETYLHNINVFGTYGLESVPSGEDTRAAYGVRVPSTGFDTSYAHVFTKRTKVGLYSERAIIGFDGHFVGCDTALHLKGNGGNANQNAHFGVYADYSWRNGILLDKMNGASIYSPNIFMIGVHAASRGIEGNVFGMFFEGGSKNNLITGTNFNTTQIGLDRTNSLIGFSSEAKNNIFVGVAGDYKVNQLNEERFRKQTVMGATGKWGRFNNLNRKNRSRLHEITPATPQTVVFHLDAEYPSTSDMQDNFFVFKGTWTMKEWGEGKFGAFGELYVVIQPDGDADPFLENKVTIVGGAEHLNLEIISTQLLGDTLEVGFKVIAHSNVTLAVELERTVDPRGMMF